MIDPYDRTSLFYDRHALAWLAWWLVYFSPFAAVFVVVALVIAAV